MFSISLSLEGGKHREMTPLLLSWSTLWLSVTLLPKRATTYKVFTHWIAHFFLLFLYTLKKKKSQPLHAYLLPIAIPIVTAAAKCVLSITIISTSRKLKK